MELKHTWCCVKIFSIFIFSQNLINRSSIYSLKPKLIIKRNFAQKWTLIILLLHFFYNTHFFPFSTSFAGMSREKFDWWANKKYRIWLCNWKKVLRGDAEDATQKIINYRNLWLWKIYWNLLKMEFIPEKFDKVVFCRIDSHSARLIFRNTTARSMILPWTAIMNFIIIFNVRES